MHLSDRDLEAALATGRIALAPPVPPDHIAGASIDLTLSHRFRLFDSQHAASAIDLTGSRLEIARQIDMVMRQEVVLGPEERFFLHPGEMALGATAETLTLADDLVGWINGRSSLARLGLMVHITAHLVDPGWSGPLVLEFFNSGRLPLALAPGMRICSVAFVPLSSPAARPYNRRPGAKYLGQSGPQPSRFAWDAGAGLPETEEG